MKTLFRSQELWDLIEDVFTDVVESDAEDEKRSKEIRKGSKFFVVYSTSRS